MGSTGRNPRVRYPGIDPSFGPLKLERDVSVLRAHGLQPGYILTIGNGLPHKNLGVLLEVEDQLSRKIVLVGVSEKNRQYWELRTRSQRAKWIGHVEDDDLPSIIRGAFCLAQPSTAEGYGYPPLEAMACGVPAVTSKIPVLFETTGSVALYVDPHDSRTWAEALHALEHEATYRAQVEKGLQWVAPLRGRGAWEKHLCDVNEILVSLEEAHSAEVDP